MRHNRFIQITIALLVAVLFVLCNILPSIARAATLDKAKEPPAISHSVPSWVAKANPYVHISNYVATVDPAVQQQVTTQELQVLMNSVAHYNTLSVQEKSQSTSVVSAQAIPYSACHSVVTKTVEWWGIQFYFNHCALNTMIFGEGVVAIIAAAIVSLCTPCTGVAGVLAGIVLLDASNLAYLDNQCGGAGAYINETWVGVWWDSSVC